MAPAVAVAGTILKHIWPLILTAVTAKAAPVIATKLQKTPTIPITPGFSIPGVTPVPTTASKIVGGIGKGAGAVTSAVSAILPYVAMTAGRGIQAASTAAGAGVGALGNVLGHLSPHSDLQIATWGKTPIDSLAGIASDVGNATGMALSGVGNAAGSIFNDIGNTMRMAHMYDSLHRRQMRQIKDVQDMELNNPTANVIARMISSNRQATRP